MVASINPRVGLKEVCSLISGHLIKNPVPVYRDGIEDNEIISEEKDQFFL
jgi:hypothetical protein